MIVAFEAYNKKYKRYARKSKEKENEFEKKVKLVLKQINENL